MRVCSRWSVSACVGRREWVRATQADMACHRCRQFGRTPGLNLAWKSACLMTSPTPLTALPHPSTAPCKVQPTTQLRSPAPLWSWVVAWQQPCTSCLARAACTSRVRAGRLVWACLPCARPQHQLAGSVEQLPAPGHATLPSWSWPACRPAGGVGLLGEPSMSQALSGDWLTWPSDADGRVEAGRWAVLGSSEGAALRSVQAAAAPVGRVAVRDPV